MKQDFLFYNRFIFKIKKFKFQLQVTISTKIQNMEISDFYFKEKII